MSAVVLVAGATGYAGRFLVAELAARGCRVRAIVRDRARAEAPGPHGAPALAGLVSDWVVGEITDPAAMSAERLGLAEVTHIVSALGVTRQKADPWEVDFRANLHLLQLAEQQAADQTGPRSFLYLGVIGVHTGTSLLMRAKAAFTEALRRSRVTPQIINPSGYFSDASEFLDLARRGVSLRIGDGDTRLNPIHGADLATFCADRLPGPSGSWDVGGPDILTYRELAELGFQVLDRRPRWVRLPQGATGPLTWAADRLGPRASSLGRFFLEGMTTDAVGERVGSRRLVDYFTELAGAHGSTP